MSFGLFSPETTSSVSNKTQTAVATQTLSDALNKTTTRSSNYSDVGGVKVFVPSLDALGGKTSASSSLLWIAIAGAAMLLILYFLKR